MTVIIAPKGTTTSNPKYTFSGYILNQFDLKWDSKGVVSNSFSAKAASVTVGNF